MSAADYETVKRDWDNLVVPHQNSMSHELFLGYLVVHPEDGNLFRKFGAVEGLPCNSAFLRNAQEVFKFLGDMMKNLGSLANQLIRDKAAEHKKNYGVGKPQFENMFTFLPEFMDARGGDSRAWRAVCKEWALYV